MKTLILGCDGYIGNALTQRLLKMGHEIVGIDNFIRRTWIRHTMLSFSAIPINTMDSKKHSFNSIGKFKFFKLDISEDRIKLDKIIEEFKRTTIVNLAHIP